MDFPPDWDVNPLGEYEIAAPVIAAASTAHTLELLAQLRPTGQILDGFRLSMDGPLLERQLDLGQLIPVAQGHPDPPEHDVNGLDRRSCTDLRQRGSGIGREGPGGSRRPIHGVAGVAPGGRTGVGFAQMGGRHR
jgi:hypothetical protein